MVTNCVLIGGPYDKQSRELTQPYRVVEFPSPMREAACLWESPNISARATLTTVRYVWLAREGDWHYYRHESLPHDRVLTYLTQ